MTVVSALTFAMLGTGVLLALVRLALGPSLLDRVVATDALLVIISAGLAVYAALTCNPTVVPVLDKYLAEPRLRALHERIAAVA